MVELERLGIETIGSDDGRGIVLEIIVATADRNAMIAGIKQLKYVKHVNFGAEKHTLRERGHGVGMEPVLPIDLACIPTDELESLEIWGDDIADAHVRLLAQPLHLRTLQISSANVTGECLDHFSAPNLTSLELRHCPISPEGSRNLVRYRNLKHLVITHAPKFEDREVGHLIDLQNLRFLDLSRTSVTDEGLQLISKHLQKLEILNLNNTKITDGGLLELRLLSFLERLEIGSHDREDAISAEAAQQLSKLLPACQIKLRMGEKLLFFENGAPLR